MARRVLPEQGMRILVGFLIIACVIGFFYSRRPAPDGVTAAPASVASTAQSTTPSEPSKYNMPKRALDRAADVKRQVLEQRKANDAP